MPFASEASRLRLSPGAGRLPGPDLPWPNFISRRHDLACAAGRPGLPAAAGMCSFLAWLAFRGLRDARRLAARFARSAADGSRNLATPAVPA